MQHGPDKRAKCIQIGPGGADNYQMAVLDIIAHELGHALASFRQAGAFDVTGEAPKISESTADMFAMLVSDSHRDPKPHWIGEQTFKSNYSNGTFLATPTDAFRKMDDPAASGMPACYTAGIGALDAHKGAGPGDHMFYLLTYGGTSKCDGSTVTGVGAGPAGKIWYVAFQNLTKNATYADLRLAFVNAAILLFPSPSTVSASVVDACDAVHLP